MNAYATDYERHIHEIAREVASGAAVLFVGSGISRLPPCNLPTGTQLRNWLVDLFCESFPELNFDRQVLSQQSKTLTLEQICETVYDHAGDGLLGILDKVLAKTSIRPNLAHQFLVYALGQGNIVVTPNYDVVIERCYQTVSGGDELDRVFYSDEDFDRAYNNIVTKGLSTAKGALFKLHGTFRDIQSVERTTFDTVATILSRTGGLSPEKEKVLQALLNQPSVFIGYSARDVDIYPVLAETSSNAPIWWAQYLGGAQQVPRVLALEDIRSERDKEEKRKPTISRDYEILHVNQILLNRIKNSGQDKAVKIIVQTPDFITSVIQALPEQHRPDSFSMPDSSLVVSQQPETEDYETLRSWVASVDGFKKLLILADLATRARQWDTAIALLREVPEKKFGVEAWAQRERRLGWCHYQRNRQESHDIDKAKSHFKRSAAISIVLGNRLEEARSNSLLGLLYNTRINNFDIAQHYCEDAWEILRLELCYPSGQIDREVATIGDVEGQVVLMTQWASNLSLRNKSLLAEVWFRLGHVLNRRAGSPVAPLMQKGFQKAIEEAGARGEELAILLLALKYCQASKILRSEVGDLEALLQCDNVIGLSYTRVGGSDALERAEKLHAQWIDRAASLGWPHEFAQASRNHALALTYMGRRKEAEESVRTAIEEWERLTSEGIENRQSDIASARRILDAVREVN